MLSAILCVGLCAGCSRKTKVTDSSANETLPPGKIESVDFGDVKAVDKIEVTYTKVFQTRDNVENSQFALIEMTIKNNTDKDYTVGFHSSFICIVDDEEIPATRMISAKAVHAAASYLDSIGEDPEVLSQTTIAVGKTITHYLPLELAVGWDDAEIRFLPQPKTSNDAIALKLTPDMVKKES